MDLFPSAREKVMPMAGNRQQQSGGHVDQSWLSEERVQVESCPSLSSQGWERHRNIMLPTWSPAKLPGALGALGAFNYHSVGGLISAMSGKRGFMAQLTCVGQVKSS